MKNESKPIESEVKGGQIVEKYSKKQNSSSGEIGPRIRRGRYQALKLFEVSEGELTIIERGSPSSIYLNFAIFLISLGISFLTTLLTVNLENKIFLFTIFTIICVIGFLIGFFLLILWYRNRNEVKNIITEIRDRLEED